MYCTALKITITEGFSSEGWDNNVSMFSFLLQIVACLAPRVCIFDNERIMACRRQRYDAQRPVITQNKKERAIPKDTGSYLHSML